MALSPQLWSITMPKLTGKSVPILVSSGPHSQKFNSPLAFNFVASMYRHNSWF